MIRKTVKYLFTTPVFCLPVFAAIALTMLSINPVQGRKIKQSMKVIRKDSGMAYGQSGSHHRQDTIGIHVGKSDSILYFKDGKEYVFTTSSIKFTGYDKNLASTKESFHIINGSGLDIKSMFVKIIYKDMSGRMLHSREISIREEIPCGETRKVDIPSWDTQKTFYYYLSTRPKRIAAPYKISISLLSLSAYE